MSSDRLTLRAGDASVAVSHDGGRLTSLRVGDLEVLVTEGDAPSRRGSFPMVPWCGRLAEGRLRFHGESHAFPLTHPPHALHGLTHTRAWHAVGPNSLRTELVPPWPFPGHVLQHFELGPGALCVTLEVHADRGPMPAMAGWHPWFRRRLSRGGAARLEFQAAATYALDDTMIPTGALVAPPEPPWDRCFRDVVAGPRIEWPGALSLSLWSTFDHWVVYTEPAHALCVEPQSGPPNALNAQPRLVHPGSPLIGSMWLRWSDP